MLLLALESSCDETAAAVVADGRLVRSNIVSSQIAVHAEYGGVVPEIASRKHLEAVADVVSQALQVRLVEPREWQTADPTGRYAVNLNRPEDWKGVDRSHTEEGEHERR